MAETLNRGPYGALGSLIGNVSTGAGTAVGAIDPFDGASFFYQGTGFPDPRAYPANKDGEASGRIPMFQSSSEVLVVDALPTASAATPVDIAAAATVTNGTAMTLVSAQASATSSGQCAHIPNCPIVPAATGVVTKVFALDMGFAYGTTSAASTTVTVLDSSLFSLGQWIMIGGGGSSTTPFITQVTNPALSLTTISVSPAVPATVTRGPIANVNAYGNFPAQLTGTAAQPYLNGGVARLFDPLEGVSRAVGIAASATANGGAFVVSGYDVYGVAMSEQITAVTNTVVYGNKCFKYIAAVTPKFTDTTGGHTYSVGVADTVGFNLRTGLWEHLVVFLAGVQLTASTGFTAALASASGPSTTTTADVRGSLQVGTRCNSGAGATGGPFSGTVRITVRKITSPLGMSLATPNNAATLFGIAQA